MSVEDYLKTLPKDKVDELLELVSDIRVEKYHNPRLKFKKDQPWQMEFIGNTYIVNIALCGNQAGKSFAMGFKGVSIAAGEDPDAPHQPDPSRELKMLIVGPSWAKITETVQKDMLSMLRPDEYEVKRNGIYISKLIITAPNGGKTEILFMPSSTEKKEDSQEFEGSKFHYAFIDEGIKPDLFRKILVRLGSSAGIFYQAFTRLPETMHMAHHLVDLEKGKGEFKYLIDKGYVNIVKASNIENKYLDRKQKEMLAAGAGTAKDMELYEQIVPIWKSTEPEDAEKRQELIEQMTDTFKARIFGIVDRPAGAVFNFREEVDGKNYNMISFDELAKIWQEEEGYWDLLHDYGQSQHPATWVLTWTSRKTGTTYYIDEVYKTNMSHQQSCEELYEMLRRWKCYNTVRHCFADKQIRDPGRKDKRTDPDITIEQQYKLKHMENGDPCIPPHLQFICKQSDKNNFSHTLSMLQELIEEENPLTPGLPVIRLTYLCENGAREFKTLRYSEKEPKSSTLKHDETIGDDHIIDPSRYFINNKVNAALWGRRYQMRSEFNELAYGVGASGNPLFNI